MIVTRRRLFAVAFFGIVLIGIVLMMSRTPVLLRLPYHKNQITGDYNYVLFNPLRDRSPERTAYAYLNAMRRGNCAETLALSNNPTMPNDLTCEQLQQEYSKLRSLFVQPLRDRRDVKGSVVLYYSTTGYEGNWVEVRRSSKDWSVVGFNKIW